jgi:hypothetical protein
LRSFIVTLYHDGLVSKGIGDATALIRKRINDVNGFGHEPPSGRRQRWSGDTVAAASDLAERQRTLAKDELGCVNKQ